MLATYQAMIPARSGRNARRCQHEREEGKVDVPVQAAADVVRGAAFGERARRVEIDRQVVTAGQLSVDGREGVPHDGDEQRGPISVPA